MLSPDQHRVRREKLRRLGSGERPRVLEICSGCGGLSLGLASAGFELAAHVEIDREATQSYFLNFGAGRKSDDSWSITRDMEKCAPEDLVKDLGIKTDTSASFDVLAAGLPCQAFARIGRSKLREVTGKEDAFQLDPRAALYRRFLDYVHGTQPLAIVIENVPDILNFGGHNVPEEICDSLEAAGYSTSYTILNAAYYGVPQVRERLFIIAIADELNVTPQFPEPTHFLELPRGYESSRRVALKYVDENTMRFQKIHAPARDLLPAVTAKEALSDLPAIREHIKDPKIIRRRKLGEVLPYLEVEGGLSYYAASMRNWTNFESNDGTDGHLVRLTPRDFPIFRRMAYGADYPQALELAEKMFEDELARLNGTSIPTTKFCNELYERMVPPYDPAKFPNKWWKLDPSKPSRTLTAHMGKDTYSHIHYDSRQSRTISVREAARLQSFPDGFRFAGAMNAAFRQIGNAVPPLLGLAVSRTLESQLKTAASKSYGANLKQAA